MSEVNESKSVTNGLQRKDLYYIDPARLTISSAKDAILYDERAEKPAAERMIKSVLANGVIEPVIVRKNGTLIEVIDGRQRTKAAIEANKRLADQGADPIEIPIVFKRGEPGDLASMIIYLNEIREDDGLLVKAKKAQRLLDRGRTEEQVAEAFGLESTVTIGNWLKLLECSPKVQRLVDDGKVRLSDARKLASLDESEQIKAAEALMETAPTQKARKEKGEVKKRVANPGSRLKKFLKFRSVDANREALPDTKPWKAALVDWLMGELSGQALTEEFAFLAPLTSKAAKKARAKKDKA